MKAKLKRQKKDKAIVIGAPEWDSTVTIDGVVYHPGKVYEVEENDINNELFTKIEDKENE